MGIHKSKFNKLPGSKNTKIAGALFSLGGLGVPTPLMLDKDVLGARGSARNIGLSVDQAKEKRIGEAKDAAVQQQVAAAAAAVAEEAPYKKAQESQREALKRKGRRASILTSPQGVGDPLGIPG